MFPRAQLKREKLKRSISGCLATPGARLNNARAFEKY